MQRLKFEELFLLQLEMLCRKENRKQLIKGNVFEKVGDYFNDYYKKNEPSSPVPLLLKRAKGLVNKDFSELMQDLSPKTLKELEVIFGADKKSKHK